MGELDDQEQIFLEKGGRHIQIRRKEFVNSDFDDQKGRSRLHEMDVLAKKIWKNAEVGPKDQNFKRLAELFTSDIEDLKIQLAV